jgi:hypothetical protein
VALARPPLDLIRGRKEMEMRFSHSADSSTSVRLSASVPARLPACVGSCCFRHWTRQPPSLRFANSIGPSRSRIKDATRVNCCCCCAYLRSRSGVLVSWLKALLADLLREKNIVPVEKTS